MSSACACNVCACGARARGAERAFGVLVACVHACRVWACGVHSACAQCVCTCDIHTRAQSMCTQRVFAMCAHTVCAQCVYQCSTRTACVQVCVARACRMGVYAVFVCTQYECVLHACAGQGVCTVCTAHVCASRRLPLPAYEPSLLFWEKTLSALSPAARGVC